MEIPEKAVLQPSGLACLQHPLGPVNSSRADLLCLDQNHGGDRAFGTREMTSVVTCCIVLWV